MWRLSRAAREILGWTQEQAATAAGVSTSALKKYENQVSQSVGMTNTLRYVYEAAGVRFTLGEEGDYDILAIELREKKSAQKPAPVKAPTKAPPKKAAKKSK